MTTERSYRTELTAGSLTIDRRDVEMLEAIGTHGSIHAAADALGRSYARMQRRLDALENAIGPVTERRRGGSQGGGTDLTEAAFDLISQFERHRTDLEGIVNATESVLTGTVDSRDGELATVETAAGPVVAIVPEGAMQVEIGIRSDAVVLTDPAGVPDSDGTSLRNRLHGRVTQRRAGTSVVQVTLEVAEGVELETVVTRVSAERLGLEPGRHIVASFKATAARAVPASPGTQSQTGGDEERTDDA